MKLAERSAQGDKLVAVLVSKNFDDSKDANSKADLDGLPAAAKGLPTTVRRGNGGTPQTPTPAALAALNAALRTAEDKVIQHIFKDACKVLSAGCFAAGTKLWTELGYRNIEDIRAGERVYSRDEWDERGDIAAKIVEEVFTRYAGVYELRVGGQSIRTTAEQPFFVAGKGWTAAHELRANDSLLCADGTTVSVESITDTGEWELVFNLRVSEFHTYFVGGEGWGWAAWAHNLDCKDLEPIVSDAGTIKGIVHHVQKDIDASPAIKPKLIWGTVESLMDTLVKHQADDKPGLADCQDGKSLKTFLGKMPSQFKADTWGNYYVLHLAAQLANSGHRVSIERSFTPHPGAADLIDHTTQIAMQAKYHTTDKAGTVAKEISKALAQITGTRGELPPAGYARRVEIQLANPSNEMLNLDTAGIVAALLKARVEKSSFGKDPTALAEVRILRPDGSVLATISRDDIPDTPPAP